MRASRRRGAGVGVFPLLLFVAASTAPFLPGPVAAASHGEAPAVTVLLLHPYPDAADPLGFPFGGSDAFSARHARFEPSGRFDYPYFVADGVVPIAAIPDPDRPYLSVRDAYQASIEARAAEESPVVLGLSSQLAGEQVAIMVRIEPTAALAGEDLHLWVALAEDPVHYEPPTGLTNGVFDHRFTLRALADLGAVDLANGTATDLGHAFTLGAWQKDRLLVAAWLQQDAPSPRFDAHEVVQATHAAMGESVRQERKGVLVEVLSATWCDPCLYGDRAAEDLAVALGSARPLQPDDARYFEWPRRPIVVFGLAAAAGLAVAAWAGREVKRQA